LTTLHIKSMLSRT